MKNARLDQSAGIHIRQRIKHLATQYSQVLSLKNGVMRDFDVKLDEEKEIYEDIIHQSKVLDQVTKRNKER